VRARGPVCAAGAVPPATRARARRGDDQAAIESTPGAVRRQRGIALEDEVDDAAIARAHRLERHRPSAGAGALGHASRQRLEGLAAAVAIVVGIDAEVHDAAVVMADGAVDEVLERIEGLAAPSDEEAVGVADDAQAVGRRLHRCLDAGQADDFAQHRAAAFDRRRVGGRLQTRRARRRPLRLPHGFARRPRPFRPWGVGRRGVPCSFGPSGRRAVGRCGGGRGASWCGARRWRWRRRRVDGCDLGSHVECHRSPQGGAHPRAFAAEAEQTARGVGEDLDLDAVAADAQPGEGARDRIVDGGAVRFDGVHWAPRRARRGQAVLRSIEYCCAMVRTLLTSQ